MDVDEKREISIIDLLSILLRYKWIVIVVSILSIIISIIFFNLKTKETKENKESVFNFSREYNMDILVRSSSENFNNCTKIGNFALYLLSSNIFFQNAVLDDELKTFVRNNMSYKYNETNSILSIRLVNQNEEDAYLILTQIFNSLSKILNDFDYENCIQYINITFEEIEIEIEKDTSVIKYSIFIVFIGFVLSIILVFIVHGFYNLKNDKEAMRKLFPKKHTDKDS